MEEPNRMLQSVTLKLSSELLELDEKLEYTINRQTDIEKKSDDIIKVLKEIATNEGATSILQRINTKK